MELNPPTACSAGRFVLPALLLFSLLAVAALLYPFPSLQHSVLWQSWMDVCHFPLFLLWQMLLAAVLRALGWRHAALISAGGLLVLAALVELVQARVGRSLSLHDWLMGALGVGCGLWLGHWRQASRPVRGTMLVAVVASALLAAAPALQVSRQVWQDRQQFPDLLVLTADRLPAFWSPLPAAEDPAESPSTALLQVASCDGPACLRVTTASGVYSGVARYFEFADWRGRQALHIRVQVAEPLSLNVRIDDARRSPSFAERFNGEFRLPSGVQDLRIPLSGDTGVGRQIDLANVRKLALFVGPQLQPVSFRLLQVRLE